MGAGTFCAATRWGFAGTKAIRRMIGFAHVSDIETLEEPDRRSPAAAVLLASAAGACWNGPPGSRARPISGPYRAGRDSASPWRHAAGDPDRLRVGSRCPVSQSAAVDRALAADLPRPPAMPGSTGRLLRPFDLRSPIPHTTYVPHTSAARLRER